MHIEALCIGGPDHLEIIDLPAGQRYHSRWTQEWVDSDLNYKRDLTLYGLERVGYGPHWCYMLLDPHASRFMSDFKGGTLYNLFWWLSRLDVELIHTFMILRGKCVDLRPGPPAEIWDDTTAA